MQQQLHGSRVVVKNTIALFIPEDFVYITEQGIE
jgi:hypothetical protein